MELKPIENLRCYVCDYEGTDWHLSIYEYDIANSGNYIMWLDTDCPNCKKNHSMTFESFESNSRC